MDPPDPTSGADRILWIHGQDIFKPVFSAANTWEFLREKHPKFPCHKLVWFPQAVPCHAFVVWLAIKDWLATGVRMRSWGITQGCVFCGERNESREHLLFACPFTFTVWVNIAGKLFGRAITPYWDDTLAYMQTVMI